MVSMKDIQPVGPPKFCVAGALGVALGCMDVIAVGTGVPTTAPRFCWVDVGADPSNWGGPQTPGIGMGPTIGLPTRPGAPNDEMSMHSLNNSKPEINQACALSTY